jgi:creatinine amidohydrolase
MFPPRRRWTEITAEEFARADASRWIAVLPVAAVEQHGPHLPVGVDAMIGEGYLERAEELVPDDLPAVFLPVQTIGKSNEHSAFAGTLSISAETAIRAWTEIGASVARAGLRKIVLMTSHGGNTSVIDIVARELRVDHGMLAVTASWHRLGYPADLFSAEELRHGIHAGEIETSLMQAFRPDLVRMDRAEDFRSATYAMEQDYAFLRAGSPAGFGWMTQDLHPSGAIGDAKAATVEAGEAAADFGARAFIDLLRDVDRFPMEQLGAGPLGR